MTNALELLVRRTDDGTLRLCAPEVGVFTRALQSGALLAPGTTAGVLHALGLARLLVVPPGVHGRVVSARPERVHEPVGYGTSLYELVPLEQSGSLGEAEAGADPGESSDALALRAPHGGRFWHRASPSDPPFVEAGDTLLAGQPVGMIEVMKTFTHVHYEPVGELPPRARVLKLVAPDGTEVHAGDPLVEIEPA